jgi:hypothetical protein
MSDPHATPPTPTPLPPPTTPATDGAHAEPAAPESAAHLRDRMRSIAARLRDAAQDLGAEVMVDIPSRLGDHSGLLIALANELEQLVK